MVGNQQLGIGDAFDPPEPRLRPAALFFDVRAVVADWLPSTSTGQRTTDQAIQLVKAEKVAGILPSSQAPPPPGAILAKDLTTMAAMLDQLADELAGDPQIVARFMTKATDSGYRGPGAEVCRQAGKRARSP